MKIDNTKRRAFLAFCMDGLARALSDEDVIGPWLADGMPDGTAETFLTKRAAVKHMKGDMAKLIDGNDDVQIVKVELKCSIA